MHRTLLTLALFCVAGTALAQENVATDPVQGTPAAAATAVAPTPDAPAAVPEGAVGQAPAAAETAPTPEASATAPDDAAGQAPNDPTTADPEPAPAAVATTTPAGDRFAPPPEGMGQIVFFRQKKFAGSAVRFKVREGASELGKLGSGSYFVVPTSPGTHEYTVHSEAKDILTLEIEAGETYYVEGSINMGLMVGRPNLSPSDEAAFAAASGKLKPVR